jgi:hypothetical protein
VREGSCGTVTETAKLRCYCPNGRKYHGAACDASGLTNVEVSLLGQSHRIRNFIIEPSRGVEIVNAPVNETNKPASRERDATMTPADSGGRSKQAGGVATVESVADILEREIKPLSEA